MWRLLFLRLEEEQQDSGPWLLLSFLTCLLQRDLEAWWKHGQEQGAPPALLLSIMCGGGGDLLGPTRETVLKLYSRALKEGGQVESFSFCFYSFLLQVERLRKLLAMVALLTSQRDSKEGDGDLLKGRKVALANMVRTPAPTFSATPTSPASGWEIYTRIRTL